MIAANAAPQLQMTKQLLTLNATETDLALVQERESEMLRECWKSAEHAEAVAAFVEKRAPKFPPRGMADPSVECASRRWRVLRVPLRVSTRRNSCCSLQNGATR